jgi:ornithine decarboxylase
MSLTAVPQTAAPAITPIRAATPYLALNVEQAVGHFRAVAAQFGSQAVHYAVKANPHPALVAALVRAGSRFDVASAGEVGLCLDAGAAPADLIFSNPVKRRADIVFAYARGVRCFVADATSELHKLAAAAPGASVLVRLATSGAGSDLPQSVKFGSPEADLLGLLQLANALGLEAAGVAFHVGSQQRDPLRWELPIAQAARVFAATRKAGLRPYLLDIGGGLPARHEGDCPDLPAYARIIAAALDRHFGDERPELIVEPGRGIVGDAGTLVAEVIGITWRNGRRWVTVDVGFFSGLVEAMGEEIRYRLSTDRDGDPSGPAVLAGPTCDSVDLLYEKTPVMLPLTLSEGDRVLFHSAGAYTSTCSTVGFNGFPALPTVLV